MYYQGVRSKADCTCLKNFVRFRQSRCSFGSFTLVCNLEEGVAFNHSGVPCMLQGVSCSFKTQTMRNIVITGKGLASLHPHKEAKAPCSSGMPPERRHLLEAIVLGHKRLCIRKGQVVLPANFVTL